MTLRFVLVPQWQGSPSPRAMRLVDGVAALRQDLPAAAVEVDVPLEAGDSRDTGISRFSSLQLVRERLRDVLEESQDTTVVVGGDCGVAAGALEVALGRHPDAAVIWFDAHADLNSRDASPSKAFAGMVLREAIDSGVVAPDRVVLAGTRSWDPGEQEFASSAGIATLDVMALEDSAALAEAVAATGSDGVFVHIDLDVLDPSALTGLLDPTPFGVSAAGLVAAIRAVRTRVPLVGATLAAYAPAELGGEDAVNDAATILRIIAALD